MKHFITILILLCIITPAVFGQLSEVDLNKIRLIVKEEIQTELKPIEQKIDQLNTRIQQVEKDIASLTGRVDGIEKLITWLIIIFVAIFGIPQILVLLHNRKDENALTKQVETLSQRIEALENGKMQTPL